MLWEQAEDVAIEQAIVHARSGEPTALVVQGRAGVGKTTLLQELTVRAHGFQTMVADGAEEASQPYGLLDQWGTHASSGAGRSQIGPFLAAQGLRARIDDIAGTNPVLLRVDDLHWADPESVEALVWLLRRVSGDRLLVAVGSRRLHPDQHRSWQRWARSAPIVSHVTLSGLSKQAAHALVASRWPQVTADVAVNLWLHTAGNPLYLNTLLDEHPLDELAQMRVLPAPAQYSHAMATRLSRLPASSRELVQAAAVLGTTWTTLAELASVGDVDDAADAAEAAQEANLLEVRSRDGVLVARTTHALARAAIYEQTPLARRRPLHLKAAASASDRSTALEHRVAAADRWDDDLAQALEDHGAALHRRRSHRLAAQHLRWASNLSSDPLLRTRRRLDAAFDSVQAGETTSLDPSAATYRATLAKGAAAVLSGQWIQGQTVLAPLTHTPPDPTDPVPRYRAEVLLAWARMGSGAATDLILEGIARAESLGVDDPTLAPYALFAGGQAAARTTNAETLAQALSALPSAATDFPADSTYLLAWRGALRTHMGYLPEAVADLREAQQRIHSGLTDIAHGGFHGILGVAQWMHGQWDLAQISLRLAVEVSEDFILPLVRTYLPLHACGIGAFDDADRHLDNAMSVLTAMPWQEAVQALYIARIVRLHAGGTDAERARLSDDMRRRWPDTPLATGLVSSVWLMHAALAAIWAAELDQAEQYLKRIEQFTPQAPWAPAAVSLLRGLVDEHRGQRDSALHHLRAATLADAGAIPFYRAHMLADHARLARRVHRTDEAATATGSAQAIYRQLGATPYLAAANPEQLPTSTVAPTALADFGLSERERDVAALVSSGLSYKQIAQDLFVTRSTVGYHLSNVYAKTGVRSRHELTQLLRAK